MPTTYAHWRFGDSAMRTLDSDLQRIVTKYRELFDIGVHGPDVFFYYKCMKHNEVNDYGHDLHYIPVREIMAEFKKNYHTSPNKEASLAYILGFLAHFTLDSYCHGYIDRKAEVEGPSHLRIEAQYDRHLFKLDGKDPSKSSATFAICPGKFNARVISQLYDRFDETVMLKVIKDMVFYLNLLKDNDAIKRWILSTGMRALKFTGWLDLMMGDKDDPTCAASNLRLDKYTEFANLHYSKLAENLLAYLKDEEELCAYFDHDFCRKEDYREIPILNEEDEKAYKTGFQD